MKKVSLIINPKSGTNSKERMPQVAFSCLDSCVFEVDILYTEYAGHASLLAAKAVEEKRDVVIAAGGDGTVNEIAKMLVHSSTALGIIPLGSGNGLARDLGIPMDQRKAFGVINKCYIKAIDYCKANDYFFFCTCGVGFDALVSERFSEEKKRGSISYVKSAITEYLKFRPDDYEIMLDDGLTINEKAFLVTCANASQYGNNAFIAPHANISDGKMDVVVMAPVNPLEVGPMAFQLFTKQIENNNKLSHYCSEKVIIKRKKEGPMHIDGEPVYAGKEILLQTIPSGLKVVIPEKREKTMPVQAQIEDIQLFFRELFQRINIIK